MDALLFIQGKDCMLCVNNIPLSNFDWWQLFLQYQTCKMYRVVYRMKVVVLKQAINVA